MAVQTDVQPQWHNALCGVQTFEQAVQLRNVVRSLGSDVVVEWGYPPAVLPSVRLLHNAGIEAWWLDGDPAELLEGYKRRWKPPVDPMEVGQPYRTQKDRIDAAWPKLERFYGSRILRTGGIGSHGLPDVPGGDPWGLCVSPRLRRDEKRAA